MFEEKFLAMAISEGGRPLVGDRTPSNIVQHELSFCIGISAHSKEEYLEAGQNFLDNFEAEVLESMRSESEDRDNDLDLIAAYEQLVIESKKIDRNIFLKMLEEDWESLNEFS